MPINLYRGDTRPPDPLNPTDAGDPRKSIRAAGGFPAWVPLTPLQARTLVQRCSGAPGRLVQFALPSPANQEKINQSLIDNTKTINLDTLMADIKKGKSQTTFHSSLTISIDCGGYATGYVYKLQFNLYFLAPTAGALVQPLSNPNQVDRRVGVTQVFDGTTLATSNVIALAGPASTGDAEVSFLTPVTLQDITHYCMPGITDAGSPARPWIPVPW